MFCLASFRKPLLARTPPAPARDGLDSTLPAQQAKWRVQRQTLQLLTKYSHLIHLRKLGPQNHRFTNQLSGASPSFLSAHDIDHPRRDVRPSAALELHQATLQRYCFTFGYFSHLALPNEVCLECTPCTDLSNMNPG